MSPFSYHSGEPANLCGDEGMSARREILGLMLRRLIDSGGSMECDLDTVRAFLVTAGHEPDAVAGLDPEFPLGEQGVSPDVCAAFADLLVRGLGAPVPVPSLVQRGSLVAWAAFLQDSLDDATIKRAAIARITTGTGPLPPGEASVIDRMHPGDALGVVRLFYAIYGDNYPIVDYYVPERLIALNWQSAVLTLVARLESGAIAGHGAYYRSSPPNPAVYEQGQLLVDHAYRHTSIAFRMLIRLDALSKLTLRAEAFFGEAVCTHLVTQKTGVRQGYTPCGLELSLMPAGAYEKEGASGRVTCLLEFRVDRDRCQPLFLPECYRAVLQDILACFSLDRDLVFSAKDLPAAVQTTLTSRFFDFAQVERVQVATIGRDFPAQADALIARARSHGLAVVQVYLDTGAPGVAFAVDALRRLGFVFGGLAPLWFGHDALMLQWLAEEPDFAAITLYTDSAKTLLGHIQAEWRQSRA